MAYPQFKGKHRESALFDPTHYIDYQIRVGKIKKVTVPRNIIFCYSRRLFDYVRKNYTLMSTGFFESSSIYKNFYTIKETKNNKNSPFRRVFESQSRKILGAGQRDSNKVGIIADFGVGSPVAAVIIEELIAAGAKRFISIGMAGSLQKNLNVWDFVVCERAIRDEGTSHHYLMSGKYSYASKKMTQEIESTLQNMHLKYKRGTTWTIDAPYRETIAEVRQYKKEGVLTVEMEAAAIFAVAKYRGVEAGAIFTVSDYLSEAKWRPKFHLTQKHLARIFEVAKNVLS